MSAAIENNHNNAGDANAQEQQQFQKRIDQMALRFFRWLHESPEAAELLEDDAAEDLHRGVTRNKVGELFQRYFESRPGSREKKNKNKNNRGTKKQKQRLRMFEGRVMASLRVQGLLRSQRHGAGVVICEFAYDMESKTFAPIEERRTAQKELRKKEKDLRSNKAGISVSENPVVLGVEGGGNENSNDNSDSNNSKTNFIVPIRQPITLKFDIHHDTYGLEDSPSIELFEMQLMGSHKKNFTVHTETPMSLSGNRSNAVLLTFEATGIAVHRVTIGFRFLKVAVIDDGFGGLKQLQATVTILRDVLVRSGDPKLYDALEAKKPYTKRKRNKREKRIDAKDIVHPPKEAKGRGGVYKGLGPFRIPKNYRQRVETDELEDSMETPWDYYDGGDGEDEDGKPPASFETIYARFWQSLLWASELQAYDDIQFFDLHNAVLRKHGRVFRLHVAGLAEGRPSVLKGDLVFCRWKSKEYRGRVKTCEQLDVVLEFHPSFHQAFDARVDRIETVRFTFARTNFRTAHAGILAAKTSMGKPLLLPSREDMMAAAGSPTERFSGSHHQFRWTSHLLNEEQKQAVREICRGTQRPLPYVIFGPPGTGKTTTLVESIYQLANLSKHDLKILVVAPSNDATDILVEKLSQYFPPSEMVRVLAYTRPIGDVTPAVRKYCTHGMEADEVLSKILGSRITVATINMAARLWCTGDGIPKGYFDVLCVDEAGHATEPEVVAVAATLMKFRDPDIHPKRTGQLVLAGDPMQLGPIVTSELCQTFDMDRSYMERLVQTSSAYRLEDNNDNYPPQLVTLLVNNYRSHHYILKLPNEMFYRNKLVASGDIFTTHSMARWEHLPAKGFPILFHAVDGENTREGNSPSWFNPQEAMITVDYVRKLTEQSKPRVAPEDIGIITPYARQVQKIRTALEVSGIQNVKVGSVETFQGQERRIILISTVRSENSLLQHDLKYNLGFVANEKRFNVAITRAKALLVVIGNPRVLETDKKNWLPLLRFCKSMNSWLGEAWEEHTSDDNDDSDDDDDDGFEKIEKDDGKPDKEEWTKAGQEAYAFINREE